MRPHPNDRVERFRVTTGPRGSDRSYGNNGHFMIECPATRSTLSVIASDGLGWEHVSAHVHGQQRTPTWTEMSWLKELFWDDEETVIEYHPPRSQYKNIHPYTLHLWRPRQAMLPRPPLMLV